MIFVAILGLLLFPVAAQAAYLNPVIAGKQIQDSGFIKVTFEFSGDAGEPTIKRDYLVRPTSTTKHVREWVHTIKQELDFLFAASKLPQVQIGQRIPALTPSVVAATACEVWQGKFSMYTRIRDAGINAATVDINALKTELENTYPTGCITQ